MHVSLTPKLEELVRQKVETGLYNNASEVIREALRLLAEQDEVYTLKLEGLRNALAAGEASGPPRELDFDALIEDVESEVGEDRNA